VPGRDSNPPDAGSETASYHPALLLGCWCTAYTTGVFSSRKLERATYDSVAFRFITANGHPDHDTIATVRRRFLREIEGLIVRVLDPGARDALAEAGDGRRRDAWSSRTGQDRPSPRRQTEPDASPEAIRQSMAEEEAGIAAIA